MSESISELIQNHELTLRDNPIRPPLTLSTVVYFERKGCAEPSFAMPFHLYHDAPTKLKRLGKPDYVESYRYFDEAWNTQQRGALFSQWIKHTALSAVGESPYIPVYKAIVVADPADCAGDDAIDWQSVWIKKMPGQKRLTPTQTAASSSGS